MGSATGTGNKEVRSNDLLPWQRLPLLVLGFASLFLGLAAGLARLGWAFPLPSEGLLMLHGPLMVSGFFGTLISLERAVALGRRWAYLAPLFGGLGAAVLIAGAPVQAGALMMTIGSLGLLLASLAVYRVQRAVFTATLAVGAASWLVGNLLWLFGAGLFAVVPWWAGFLVLTIAAERLELSRFMPPSPTAQRGFLAGASLLIAALLLIHFQPPWGQMLLALALIGLTLWLVRYDIARRTVSAKGLTRFIAVCLLSAYGWLALGGFIGVFNGGMFAPAAYDATLHAVFLGFVFSMVFGHAPIIFPAVTRFAVHYHPVFYLHLLLLHLSLALRLAGDLMGVAELRALGGLGNGVTLVVFVLNTVGGVWRGRRSARRTAVGATS